MIEFSTANIRTWSMAGASGTLGIAAHELAERDPDFAIVTSDLCYFSGLDHVAKDFPEQIYNVGIAEQNMIGVAAGMAKEGMHVWAATYASFASARVLDQVKVNMGYMKLPIRLVGLTSGFSVGILGATHMAIEDIAVMRAIPNITILSPADCHETMKLILAAAELDKPVYLRLSGTMRTPIVYRENYELQIGKANRIMNYPDSIVSVFATGSMVSVACKAAQALYGKGIRCDVFDMHTIKPLDTAAIRDSMKKKLIVTIEEHSVTGGLGSSVAEVLSRESAAPRQLMFGINDYYPHAASYHALLEECGLTADKIADKIETYLK